MVYEIRPVDRKEFEVAIEWAAREGWNPGLYDAQSFHATDPQGFFMGFIDGEPVSYISAVAYDPAFGFIGFYIVKPEYRYCFFISGPFPATSSLRQPDLSSL